MSKIKAIFTDLDGCLTDGGMYYECCTNAIPREGATFEMRDSARLSFKKFHTRDASAARLLHERTDVKLFVLTAGTEGRNGAINKERMKVYYLTEPISHDIPDKLEKITEICNRYGWNLNEVAYIGDDFFDIEVLEAVGYVAYPVDALEGVRLRLYKGTRLEVEAKGGEGVLGGFIDNAISNGYIDLEKEDG